MTALIDPTTGLPFARSPEISREDERRLQKVDRRFFLRWVPGPANNNWALAEKWTSDDPRRRFIRSGEMASHADFDIRESFPARMTASDVVAYIEHRAERTPNTAGEAEKQARERVDALAAKNEQVKAERAEKFAHEQNEIGARRSKHERELAVGATQAHSMSTSQTPQHKRTDAIKGTDPDDRDPVAVATSGDFPFPSGGIDYTAVNSDATDADGRPLPPLPRKS